MLREMQAAMKQSVFGGDDTAAAYLASTGIEATDLLSVYRNNTFASLVGVLEAAYPVLCSLVGAERFRHAAYRFAEAAPPTLPQLSQYGGGFADFLAHFRPARSLPYLPDLARLEWQRNESYFAADAPTLDARALERIAPEDMGRLRFRPHPSVRLLATAFPVLRFVDATSSADGLHILTHRTDASVGSVVVSPGDYALVRAFSKGATLEAAAAEALAAEPDIELQQTLLLHIQRGTFSTFVLDNLEGSTT